MNKTAQDFVEYWQREALNLEQNGLYSAKHEKDACGVGFVASLTGKPSREVVTTGIAALKALFYRGAVDADGKTGDGAGIHIEIPHEFFREHIKNTGHTPNADTIAVGMIFLPRADLGAQERCRSIVETEVLKFGYTIYGWRQVPVDVSAIGEKANSTRPEIEQIMIGNSLRKTEEEFEVDLYVIRRRIEKKVLAAHIREFYICSLSCRTIIYKGLFLAGQLTAFFPDLLDARFESSFVLYHQRYSTNTFPTWRLAQPFRMLAHNGEINTLDGNLNWLSAHETLLESPIFGENIQDLKPLVQPGSSDSAALDAVFELLCRGGRPAPMVKAMLIPEAAEANPLMPETHRAFINYCNCVVSPWDGPAAIVATDGRWVVGGMDRNGLRPLRYALTKNMIVVGSEAGMVRLHEEDVVEKGRVGAGEIIALDTFTGRFYRDKQIKEELCARNPYHDWAKKIFRIDNELKSEATSPRYFSREEVLKRQLACGMTMEDTEMVLAPMIEQAKEAVGSMGDDAPLAVLAKGYRGLHHFFRQNFSQVTNPPIDSLREKTVMSLRTRVGNTGNILEEDETQCDIVQLESPVLLSGEFEALENRLQGKICEIDCTLPVDSSYQQMQARLEEIRKECEAAVREGRGNIVLSDMKVGETRAAMPMILVAGAVHSHLVAKQLRTYASIHVRSGECLDTHYFAVLIGVGATTVNAYLAEEAIADRHERGLCHNLPLAECLANYRKSINQGLLKIMAKMGIGIVSAYRGGYNFEALGLSRALVATYLPGIPSRISGIGIKGLHAKLIKQHQEAYSGAIKMLPAGGFYRYRHGSEAHYLDGELLLNLQKAVDTNSYTEYKRYVEGLRNLPPVSLRDLIEFKENEHKIPREDVESITEIRKRFYTPGMSLGALSPEAHRTLNVAMNRIGSRSVSGEGGENPDHYRPNAGGDNANSAIKQVASGRFGVTAEYLNQCSEIEIKVAQGAKPGEGGQLPGFKVSEMIARLRHSTPGVTLISPPPHHDIYSIEDLAQLIYDLKQINPIARVGVKLVARGGIGTIAAGVAKAGADFICVSGHTGGTGASPLTSVKFAGLPWEMGLAEANQVLTLNGMRGRVKLRADGGLRSGRDIVVAAMLGAEEFGIGTISLVALGCVMARQCHSNTCPMGVCTQDEALRKNFKGTPEKVINLFSFIAEDVRTILASLGCSSLNEVIGRTDYLYQASRGDENLDDLDLNPLMVRPDAGGGASYCQLEEGKRNEVPPTLDDLIVKDARPALEDGAKMQLTYTARNTHRTVGAKLSHEIVKRFGLHGLNPEQITLELRGSAGQSLGAFAVQGLRIEVLGEANDYVGKGLSGAKIIVKPTASSMLKTNENVIIGNTVLYGATSGKLFASGLAGERFGVRNSGAEAVIEGCGSNGCEYMTGGTVVILGKVGHNFAAGMTGGMAFVYDASEEFLQKVNHETVVCLRPEVKHYETILESLVSEHLKETGSPVAAQIIEAFEAEKKNFWQVVPKEMVAKLTVPIAKNLSSVA